MAKRQKAGPKLRRSCGAMAAHMALLEQYPQYRANQMRLEGETNQRRESGLDLKKSKIVTVKTVVHVVYNTDEQNISDAQIASQIDVLNADFRRRNADVANAPAPFAPLATDARVQFVLADVTRTKTTVDSFDSDDAVKSAATGGADAWDAETYLNLWVCQLGGGLLGYAQFPGGPAATDGVVVLHSGFGTTGTAAAPFDLGRTTTHEVGHWLNLRHIWGDDGTGCAGDDFVPDTPNQGGPNYGTPAFPTVSCDNGPDGDMFMDYMDYVDDAAMFMFSAGQVTRMQATLDGARSAIGNPVACE